MDFLAPNTPYSEMVIRLALVLALLVASCTASPGSSTARPDSTTTSTPTTTMAATIGTTTTSLTATTTTVSPIVEPSGDVLARYLQAATANGGRFTSSTMGPDAWAAMLRNGAVAACEVFVEDGPLPDAIAAAIAQTPVADVPVTEYRGDEFGLASTLVLAGSPAFCPSVAPALSGEGEEILETFFNAWQEYLRRNIGSNA